jgi:hypothetical protein
MPAFTPPRVDEPVTAAVNAIFDAARRGQLVVCAGAGLSLAMPTGLPGGAELGRRLDARLSDLIAGYESPQEPSNLIEVADVGKALEAGEEMLRTEVLKLAPFRNADPNYGHRMLAELLCEGGVDVVLLWNWDNCIERVDVWPEQLQVARSWKDLEQLEEQPSIAKVHGCATRKLTLLISSEDLSEHAPLWTQHAFRERLRGKTAVFIGIGDVAEYAQQRLAELREELDNNPEGGQDLDIWVVSPTIRDGWSGSRWAELVPDLAEERKIQMTADEFLDHLGRRWLREALEDLERLAGESLPPELEPSLRAIRAAFGAGGAARALRWCRRAALGQEVGRAVAFCDGLKEALMAFAMLARSVGAVEVVLRDPAAFVLGSTRVEALIACEAVSPSKVRDRARQRAEVLANQGAIDGRATFLVSGSVPGRLDNDPDVELDLTVGESAPDDLVAGASGVSLSFLRADAMLAEAA